MEQSPSVDEAKTKRARAEKPDDSISSKTTYTIFVSQLSGVRRALEFPIALCLRHQTEYGTAEVQARVSDLKFEIARMITANKLFIESSQEVEDEHYEVMHPDQHHCGAWRIDILKPSTDKEEMPSVLRDVDYLSIDTSLVDSASIVFVINVNFELVVIHSDEDFFAYFLKGDVPESGGPLADIDSLEIDFDKIKSYDSAPKAFKFDCSDDDWDVMDFNGPDYVVHPVVCQVWNFLLDPEKCKSVLNCVALLNCDDTDPIPCGDQSQLDQGLLRRKTCPLERVRLMRTQAWPFWQVPCLGGQRVSSSEDAEWMGDVKLSDYSTGEERKLQTKEALQQFRMDQGCCYESVMMVASYQSYEVVE